MAEKKVRKRTHTEMEDPMEVDDDMMMMPAMMMSSLGELLALQVLTKMEQVTIPVKDSVVESHLSPKKRGLCK